MTTFIAFVMFVLFSLLAGYIIRSSLHWQSPNPWKELLYNFLLGSTVLMLLITRSCSNT